MANSEGNEKYSKARASLQDLETMSKVSNLRDKFENSNSTVVKPKEKPPEPPKKTLLLRAQTMRTDSFLYRNRQAIKPESFERMDFKQPSAKEKVEEKSDNTIYDDVAMFPIEASKKNEAIYENIFPEPSRPPPIPVRSTSVTSQTSRNSIKLINESLQSIQIYDKVNEISKKPLKMLSELKEVLRRNESVRLPTNGNARKSILEIQEDIKRPIAHIPPQVILQRESVSSFDSFDEEYYEAISTPTVPASPGIPKMTLIIQELLQNESIYILTLEQGINDYISKFDELPLPNSLKGQRINIFSNIENIHHFHKTKFLPKLKECENNPEKIAESFIYFLDESYFDKYIIYVLNRKKADKLCKENKYFFKQIQKDRLGINSFLLQPIQRIPRYQLLLAEIVKELMKDLDNNKISIATLCIAEKKIQRLLETINEYCEA